MTASFSLRLRLKVYSFKCALGASPSCALLLQRPTVLEMHPSAAGSPSALADRKSTRLNSSHLVISYAVFCLKKKNKYDFYTLHGNLPRVLHLSRSFYR